MQINLKTLLIFSTLMPLVIGMENANKLYEDLLSDYNKLDRPVDNISETLVVRFKLKLSQLLDVVSMIKMYLTFDVFKVLFQLPRIFLGSICVPSYTPLLFLNVNSPPYVNLKINEGTRLWPE